MDPKIFWQLSESYQRGVYGQVNEDVLSEEEYLAIEEWVENLLDEGYDLSEFSDDELYEAYLEDLYEQILSEKNISRSQALAKADKNFKYPSHQKVRRKIDRLINSEDPTEVERGNKIHNILATIRAKTSINKAARNISRGPGPRRAKSDAERDMRDSGYVSENLDLYDVISDYLVQEKYCDSYQDAQVIMANMSEEWRDEIIEATVMSVTSPEGKKRPLNVAKAKPARNIQDTNPVMKQIRDKKREQEGSSFSPTAERRAKTRSQPQISASRQIEVDRRAPFIARRLMQKYGLSPSDFS